MYNNNQKEKLIIKLGVPLIRKLILKSITILSIIRIILPIRYLILGTLNRLRTNTWIRTEHNNNIKIMTYPKLSHMIYKLKRIIVKRTEN